MNSGQNKSTDQRIEKIMNMIIRLNMGDFGVREKYSSKGDDLDAVIVGLNTLGEEIEASGKSIRDYEMRVNSIMQVLLKYTVSDFSEPARLSGIGDELDAIVVGLNTMAEELISAREAEQQQIDAVKANEEKIKKLNDELSRKVQQLEAANAELEAFTYSVSHDLRAPLRAIHGYTKLLSDDHGKNFNEEAEKMMQSVMMNAKKMGQLIDDLLAFSRLGRKELLRKPLDLNELVKQVMYEIEKNNTNFKAKVTIHDLGTASVDQGLMYQVFYNLISNSVKYSSTKDRPEIEVGVVTKENEKVYYVKDNGVGFSMKFYDKLFGVFQRLHSNSDFEGTGVGLALVKRIILKHHGQVWAEAEPDKGATFYFTLENP